MYEWSIETREMESSLLVRLCRSSHDQFYVQLEGTG